MTGEQSSRRGPATDRRRIGVWENEGGHPTVRESPTTEAPAPTNANTRWMRAFPLSDLPDEGAIHLELSGVPICLARGDGVVHARLDECSHNRIAVSDGDVAVGVVECWLHGSSFDLITGVPTGPPAIAPVPAHLVRVVADVVEVAIWRPRMYVSLRSPAARTRGPQATSTRKDPPCPPQTTNARSACLPAAPKPNQPGSPRSSAGKQSAAHCCSSAPSLP